MRVTLQFHPDWPFGEGLVIESMARDGVYRSQFETGSSNGGLTAHEGGDRWRWESRLFDGRYDGRPPSERPVYGALNHRDRAHGGSIRFGSAYLRLRPEVTARCTFCFPDSAFQPEVVSGPDLVDQLIASAETGVHDLLDDYVEAHVHGGIVIERDVEAVVLDPCFRDTAVERAGAALGCGVEWHPGFRVATERLDPGYRGEEYVALARLLGEVITPDVVGAAARSGTHDPQALKRVWHYLARFGRVGAA